MTNIKRVYAVLLTSLLVLVVLANVAAAGYGGAWTWLATFVLAAGWGVGLARFARME